MIKTLFNGKVQLQDNSCTNIYSIISNNSIRIASVFNLFLQIFSIIYYPLLFALMYYSN